jgi:hypothetical protein
MTEISRQSTNGNNNKIGLALAEIMSAVVAVGPILPVGGSTNNGVIFKKKSCSQDISETCILYLFQFWMLGLHYYSKPKIFPMLN